MKDEGLEASLSEMTAWRGGEPGLWRRALEETGREERKPRGLMPVLGRRIPDSALAAAVALLFVVGIFLSLPSLGGRARRAMPPTASAPAAIGTDAYRGFAESAAPSPEPTPSSESVRGPAAQAPSAASAAERYVVRKATIELETPDVAAAFAKAVHAVSAARGEYVQESSITGEGRHARATLTLRIAADRLGAALNELRQLGDVRAETTSGEDVTAQMVDLDARLRNEQRVETELLQLLESRADAPLKEVLELRESLGNVRESIESMTGRREHLSRLVSLATVLVIIRTGDSPEVAKSGLGEYFVRNVGRAWGSGLTLLADTVAGLVKIAVGGAVWWVLLAIAVALIVRWRRRTLSRGV